MQQLPFAIIGGWRRSVRQRGAALPRRTGYRGNFGTRLRSAAICMAMIAAFVPLSGCDTRVPDRRDDINQLSAQLGSMPGVQAAHADYANHWAEGAVMFAIHLDATESLTADELASVVDTYLQNLASGRYRDYHTELEIRRGWNVFAVDSSDRPIANTTQILDQARNWIALRTTLPGATVALRSTISHPLAHLSPREIGSSNRADIELPEGTQSMDIAGAVSTIAARFPYLAVLNWTVSAARAQDQIAYTGRFPTAAELELWRRLTTDQTIAHTDSMQINGPVTPPVWLWFPRDRGGFLMPLPA